MVSCFGSKRSRNRQGKTKERNVRVIAHPIQREIYQTSRSTGLEQGSLGQQTQIGEASIENEPEPWSMAAVKRRMEALDKERIQNAMKLSTEQRKYEEDARQRYVMNQRVRSMNERVGEHKTSQRALRGWTWGADERISAADLMRLRSLSPDVDEKIKKDKPIREEDDELR